MTEAQGRPVTITGVQELPIEKEPSMLHWSRDPITTEEEKRAEEMFRWISRH